MSISKTKSEQTYVPLTVDGFRQLNTISTPLFIFPIPYKSVTQHYIVYRNQEWSNFNSLKTIVALPGNAFVNFNTINADVIYPGLLHELSQDTQIIVAKYPNAPEHKYPAPLIHLKDTVSHLIDQSSFYKIDQNNIILTGYSTGGTLSVPLAIHFASLKFIFRSILFVSPIFDYSGFLFNDRQLQMKYGKLQRKDNKNLNQHFIDFMNSIYCNSVNDLFQAEYSPVFTSDSQLAKLPNSIFVYGQNDFMRRTIEAFKVKLIAAKVNSQSHILQKEGHLSLVMVGKTNSPMSSCLKFKLQLQKKKVFNILTNCIKQIWH